MSSSAIAWIVSIFFILILVAGFFIGFWRGLKRSTANLIITVVGAIVAFFITPPITNVIMGITVQVDGSSVTLGQAIIESIKNNQEIAVIIDRNPNLELFFERLPSALANVLVFIVVTTLVELVLYIIYKIIAMTVLKYKDDEKKHRVWGGAVGLVKTFLLTIFAFMPLAGLTGLYDSLQSSNEVFYTTAGQEQVLSEDDQKKYISLIEDNVPSQVNDIMKGLEDNALIKICGIFGLDNATFDYMTKIKVNDESINIRKELLNYYPVANFVYQIDSRSESGLVFADINFATLDKYVNNVIEGGLFNNIAVDFIADFILNYQEYNFMEIPENVQEVLDSLQANITEISSNKKVLQLYFQNDLKNAYNIIKEAGTSGMIDEINNLPEEGNVIDVLVSEKNITPFKNAVNSAFDINMVQDAIIPITQNILKEVSADFDNIGTDISDWTDEDWDNLSTSIVNVMKDYNDLSKKVDVFELIENPIILVDNQKDYDVESITNEVGSLIDEVRSIELLKTSDGKSIMDKMFASSNLTLPTGIVKDSKGQDVQINNYKDLFGYLAPALVDIKTTDLYNLLSNEQDAGKLMGTLASIIAQEGNQDILKDILLPISQVEPTKTLVFDEMIKTIKNNIVDFTVLNTFEDWDNDLTYISKLLVDLNTMKVGGATYLTLAMNGQIDTILENISQENLDDLLNPIFYAKSTASLRDDLSENVENAINKLTDPSVNHIDLSSITLEENNPEDQANEIVTIFGDFISLNKVITDDATIKTIDKDLLAKFLTDLQANAYRTILSDKQETGVFNNMFKNLVEALKIEYKPEIDKSAELQEALSEENYPNIDFTMIFDLLEQIEGIV